MQIRLNSARQGRTSCSCLWGFFGWIFGGFGVFLKWKEQEGKKTNHAAHGNLQGLGDDEAGSALSNCIRVCATN